MSAQEKPASQTQADPKPDSKHLPALLEAIRAHPFLKGLSKEQLDTLSECAMLKSFEPNELIFQEQEQANRFYLIQEGQVALETDVVDQGPVVIQTLGAGEVLGWSWLFPPYHWHFSARAIESTRAIFFYGTRLREWCERDHDLGFELIQRMAAAGIQRLQVTRRRLADALGRGGR